MLAGTHLKHYRGITYFHSHLRPNSLISSEQPGQMQTNFPSGFLVTSRSGLGIALMRVGVVAVGESSFGSDAVLRSKPGSVVSTKGGAGALKVATLARSPTTESVGSAKRSASGVGSWWSSIGG